MSCGFMPAFLAACRRYGELRWESQVFSGANQAAASSKLGGFAWRNAVGRCNRLV